jgi:hypothetical protein
MKEEYAVLLESLLCNIFFRGGVIKEKPDMQRPVVGEGAFIYRYVLLVEICCTLCKNS